MSDNLYIIDAAQIVTVGDDGGPKRGPEMSDIRTIGACRCATGAIRIADGKMAAVGSTEKILTERQPGPGDTVLSAQSRCVIPGFVDCHTHLVYAGDRVDEFEQRLAGATYQEILEAGGGIRSTVEATRAADEDSLVSAALRRAEYMLRHGTTTIEVKSGYGLTLEHEIAMLETASALAARSRCDIVRTLLGAHVVPREYEHNRGEYVRIVIEEMIPQVAEDDLAKFCDVYCDDGAFTPDEARQILLSGKAAGLVPKIHADQWSDSQGARIAADVGAVSADHLDYSNADGLAAMRDAGVIGVVLPGVTHFLQTAKRPDARAMIAMGLPIAIATDHNPGSSTLMTMGAAIDLACLLYRMTPAEALCAATLNAAYAVGMGDEIGSIDIGKQADLVILDVPDYRMLAYHTDVNHIETVIKNGRIVHTRNPHGLRLSSGVQG